MSFHRCLLFASLCLLLIVPAAAWPKPRPAFMDQYRIGFLPYVYPYEATTQDLDKLFNQGYDCIHIGVAAPYNGTVFSDLNRVDAAITRCVSNGKKIILTINPRWLNVPWIGDTLSDGSFLQNSAIQSPNYAMLDVFEERQVAAYLDYCRAIIQRYEGNSVVPGSSGAIVAYCLAWGLQAETGLFTGDFNTSFDLMGSVNSGYSTYTLQKFNLWRVQRNMPQLGAMPAISDPPSADFVRMMRFRHADIARHFHDRVVHALRANTTRPIGTFTYFDPSTQNYARNWTYGDALDFSRTAGITPSAYQGTALVDSGIGWEGGYQHQGTWDFTAACMQRDEFRNLAIGNRMHGMFVREYETAPQWEANLFTNVSQYLVHETDRNAVQPLRRELALYVPTWANALLQQFSASQPYMPASSTWTSLGYYVGLVESFGVPYDLISDRDLLDLETMRGYRLVVLPAAAQLAQGLEPAEWAAIGSLPNIYQGGVTTPSRSTFRTVLSSHGIDPPLDYVTEDLRAGMFNNFLWNWDPASRSVTVGGGLPGAGPYTLGTHERKIVFTPLIKLTSSLGANDSIAKATPGAPLHARVSDSRFNVRPAATDFVDVLFAPERGLDQNQLRLSIADGNRSAYAGHPLQQSFTPSKARLASIGIRGGKVFGYTGNLIVRVGTTLGGNQVAQVTLSAAQVPDYADATYGAWLQVPINQTVTPGTVLYVQIDAPTGTDTGARFAWAWDAAGPYARGAAYQAGVLETADFSFFSTASGDAVPAILMETGANTGLFTGSINTSNAAADPTNAVLQLAGAQAVGAFYEAWPCAMAWLDRTASDTQGPTTPAALHMAQVTAGQLVLGWSTCNDPTGVPRYRVYRDGVQLAEVTYPFYAMPPAQAATGSYTVVAFDRLGNASAASAPLKYAQWEFNEAGFQEGWLPQSGVISATALGTQLRAIVSSCDPALASPPLLLDTSKARNLTLVGSFASGATALRLSWITQLDSQWDALKSVDLPLSTPTALTEYKRALHEHPQWKDTVTGLRVTVLGQCSGTFLIDALRFSDDVTTSTSVKANWFRLD